MQHFWNRITHKSPVNHIVMRDAEADIKSQPLWEAGKTQLRVRLASEEDIDIFVSLEEDAYEGFQAWLYSDFETDLKKNPYCMYIIVEETVSNYPVAMISGRFLARGAHISHLLVRREYQGRYIGNRLLNLWMDLVKKRNIPEVSLEVRKSNLPAQMLYMKEGFVKVKEIPHYYSDNLETAYFLRHRFRDQKGLFDAIHKS